MSNFINPWLVEGYVDEQDTESVQGFYIGEDPLWEGEIASEKAIQEERERFIYIQNLKQSIKDLKCQLARCSKYHHRKRERIESKICKLEEELKRINDNL